MDQAKYLQLSESLDGFRSKLRARAKTLNVCERQQIVRLLIKEILVDDKNLTICHSIPISPVTPTPKHAHPLPSSTPSITPQTPSYPLRWGVVAAPCGSPAVSHLHGYIWVRKTAHPSVDGRPQSPLASMLPLSQAEMASSPGFLGNPFGNMPRARDSGDLGPPFAISVVTECCLPPR
jgi:hypothetical protein